MKTLRQVWLVAFATFFVWLAPPPAFAQAGGIGAAVGSALRIDGFDVEQVPRLAPGTALNFSLYGTAGASATLRIEGARRTLPLQEVQAGVYEGTYVIGEADRIAPDSRVTADVWLAHRTTTAVLEEPLVLGTTVAATTPATAASACADCAIVESIRPVQEHDRPGVLGAMAGGVIGAIIGSQVVGRSDRTAAGILGAVGGAYVGREIERERSKRTRYEVVVRFPDGVAQTRRFDTPPPFRVGDRVRLADGTWLPDAAAVAAH